MSSKIDGAGVGADQPLELVRRRSTGIRMSLRPHTISVGTSISRQPLAERVAEHGVEPADEARRRRAPATSSDASGTESRSG